MRTPQKSAFTLIELIVVLIVLMGLATIIVPRLPGMMERTHVSTGSSNLAGLAKAVQQFEATNFGAPDNLDSLLDENDGVFTLLPGSAGTGVITHTLTAAEADALSGSGITTLKALDSATESATFDNYHATDISVAAAETIAILGPGTEDALNLDTANVYAVFGVGPASDLVGDSLSEAPVHFPEGIDGSPNSVYSRFGVVYDISGEGAEYVMTVAFHDESVDGLEHVSEEFWEVVGE